MIGAIVSRSKFKIGRPFLKGSTSVEVKFLLTQSPNPSKLTGIIMVKSEKKQHIIFTILALLSMLLRKEDRFLDFYETISRLVLLGRWLHSRSRVTATPRLM